MNVAYIPLRGGSKSIPKKNIKLLAGKPLCWYAIKAACECETIDMVYVSTDCKEILAVVEAFGFDKLTIIGRSIESADDEASTEYAMLEFASKFSFCHVALIQATSPLVQASDVQKGFELINNGADSCLSVVRQKRFIWKEDNNGIAAPFNYQYAARPLRQDFSGFLVENGAFYITSRSALLSSGCRISGNIKLVEMADESYFEIDEPSDWIIGEALIKQSKRDKFIIPDIKMFLTDCDGTLTDAGMYYSPEGEILKKFNTRDGMGLRLLHEKGIITGIITGENTEIVQKRALKLGVDEIFIGVENKKQVLMDLSSKHGISINNIAYVGDDINDLEVIQMAGLGVCVNDGAGEVKKAADYVTIAKGGHGAVREAADLILGHLNGLHEGAKAWNI